MKKIFTILLLSAVLSSCNQNLQHDPSLQYLTDLHPDKCCTVIAHAAGSIYGNAYTNSKEAFIENIELGTRLFEIDFIKTSDGVWVAAHDWGHWSSMTGYAERIPPVFEVFRQQSLIQKGQIYTPLSLDDTNTLATENNVRIITDVDTNGDEMELIDFIANNYELGNFIVQAYSLEQVREIHSKYPDISIILTLYKIQNAFTPAGMSEDFLQQLSECSDILEAVTMPLYVTHFGNSVQQIKSVSGLPVLVHGSPAEINSRQLHMSLGRKGVSGFYLD